MKSVRIVALGGGLLAGVLLAVALQRMSAADQPTPSADWADPCEGQTDEECNLTIDRLRSEGNARITKWVNDFIASGQDPRALPRSFTTALAIPPLASLDLAVESADTIVVGEITDVEFEVALDDQSGPASVWGTAHVSVESALKGGPVEKVKVLQSGGPWPNHDMDSGSLAYSEATPYLLKGDRALLFLVKDELGYFAQAWTGTYLLDDKDSLDAVTGNPFEASVEAKTLSEFSEEIGALVAKQAQSAR